MIKPLKDNLVIKPSMEEKKTKSGILLSSEDNKKPQIGIVVSVGPDVKDLNEKDKIIYKDYAGTNVNYNSEELLIIKEEDILAVIK